MENLLQSSLSVSPSQRIECSISFVEDLSSYILLQPKIQPETMGHILREFKQLILPTQGKIKMGGPLSFESVI